MAGYEIDIERATQCANDLATIIEKFAGEIRSIEQTENDMLSDELWHGPNKTTFMQRMNEYKKAVKGLHDNAVEHQKALTQIISAYIEAEN